MTPLLANAGVPMLVIQWPLMAMALVPIVLVEVAVMRRSIAVPYRTAFLNVGLANVASTLVGVPLAWAVMVVIELAVTVPADGIGFPSSLPPAAAAAAFLVQVAWLSPDPHYLYWMIPAAATILLVPCFFASVPIERWVLAWRWQTVDRAQVRAAVLWANVWSYALLLVAGSIWTLVSLQ